ncbi:LppU/SCO3897 family protein [Asanoa siamensis]|uniref:LppU/SCO3897 family protein n=1 Tax=Asanoa siamensis TaxID=926357 RepID=UPI001940FE6E|nr:hypothetical protein [Asanoa siamensis]
MSDEVTTSPPRTAAGLSRGRKIRNGVIGLLVLLIVFVGVRMWSAASDGSGEAGTGDCLVVAPAPDDFSTVDCADPTARWRVIGKIDDVPKAEFNPQGDNHCDATAKAAFWFGKEDNAGYVLCLELLER